jgi:hypothetical protein
MIKIAVKYQLMSFDSEPQKTSVHIEADLPNEFSYFESCEPSYLDSFFIDLVNRKISKEYYDVTDKDDVVEDFQKIFNQLGNK